MRGREEREGKGGKREKGEEGRERKVSLTCQVDASSALNGHFNTF